MTLTKEEKAIQAVSLVCETKRNNLFYNAQVIEINKKTDQWKVSYQYGTVGLTGTSIEGKEILSLRAAGKKLQEMAGAKISGGGGNEYKLLPEAILPIGTKIMSLNKIKKISEKIEEKKVRSSAIDLKDPELISFIENDRYVAVGIDDISAGTHLIYVDGTTFIKDEKLLSDHSIAKSAKRIGENFAFGGYLIKNIFYVVDVISEAFNKRTFEKRLENIELVVTGANTRNILSADFYFGRSEKMEAIKKAIQSDTSVKFISLDETRENGKEYIYPQQLV